MIDSTAKLAKSEISESLLLIERVVEMQGVLFIKEFLRNAFNMDTQGTKDFARNLHATVNSSSLMRP